MKLTQLFTLTFVLGLVLLGSGCNYNVLTTKRENVKARWANVETQLQRRGDLVGNMVEVAKMAGVQEQEVFGQIAEARSRLLNAQQATPAGEGGDKTPEQKQAVLDANNSFGGTIGRLLMLKEEYPQLKSNENFLKAQDEIVGTENRIATARKDYNDSAQDYNTSIKQFPAVIEAKAFGFQEEPYFKADETSKQVPKLDADSLRKKK